MYFKSYLPKIVKKAKEIGSLDRIIRYHPLYYARALRVINKFNKQGVLERKQISEALMNRALLYASKTPYGKQYGRNYDAWPVLEKTTLRDQPGINSAGSFLSIPASTGGTTGVPLKLLRSMECVAAEQAFLDSLIEPHGLSFRTAKIALLRASGVKSLADNKPPFGVYGHGGKRLVLSSSHLSRNTINWFVSELQKFRPQLFWIYPGMLASMIRLMGEAGLKLKIPVIFSSSESMEPELVDLAGEMLSAKIIDYYGQAERVSFAYSNQTKEYWFSPAYGYVELQHEQDHNVESGTKTVKIISTAYWNSAMPLVRYNTGDKAIVPLAYTAKDLEEVALGVKPFLGIAGRSNEYIISPNGMNISGLNQIPREVEHIIRIQIVQNSLEQVAIKILADADFNELDHNKIMANARIHIPPEIDVIVEIVEFLESLSNGKTPLVIRRV